MTRNERSEYNYIKRSLKTLSLGNSTVLTIEAEGGAEYKQALHSLYEGIGFHPCAVKTDPRRFDNKERILYIKADGEALLTDEEREAIQKALAA